MSVGGFALNNLTIFVEQAGALALIGLLSTAYGTICRHRFLGDHGNSLLGFLFGVVAVLEMHAPISPADGVIIDMRNIPVALAGAFLGWRGMLSCLIVAVFGRLMIGGIGTASGVLGMMLAGGAGLLWAWKIRDSNNSGALPLFALGMMMSVHLLAAFVLPFEIAIWFFTHAALPLVALNLLSILVVGWLLERETRLLQFEQSGGPGVHTEPETQMLRTEAFFKDLVHRQVAASPSDVSGVIVLKLKRPKQFISLWGRTNLATVLGAFRIRIQDTLVHGVGAGMTQDGRILVGLSASEILRGDALVTDMRRLLSECDVSMPDGSATKVSVSCEIIAETDKHKIQKILESSKIELSPSPAAQKNTARSVEKSTGSTRETDKTPQDIETAENNQTAGYDLFEKAEFLMISQERRARIALGQRILDHSG